MSSKQLLGWLVTLWLLSISGCQSVPRIPEVITTIPLLPRAGNPSVVTTNIHTGYTYVLCGFQHIAVFQKEQLLDLIPLESQDTPYDLTVDKEHNRLYVLNRYDDGVIVVQETQKVVTLSLAGRKPKDIAIASNGYVYVVSGHSKISADQGSIVEGNVTIISGTQVSGVIPLGRTIPTQVVADPLHNAVYVGGMDEKVVVIEDLQITARIPITASVKVMDVNPQTGDIYILDTHGYLYQVQQQEIVATLWVAKEYSVPQNMQVHPTTGDVYLVNTGGEVLVTRDMQIVAQIPLESGALKMDIDPLTGNVYVANYRKDNVSVIYDTKVITTIQVGWYPYGIGVNPTNGWVYVSNTNDSTVTILGYPDN